ncbi:MAG: AMP-binding protein [Proteobacteria bacterium]|nr:AMP-binding protein [Pseudomonadota bacterium]MBU1641712.1 AMP-binding protein [Pseudomonadota bacterium]
MLNIIVFILRNLLRLRYRITLKGMDRIKPSASDQGILFLPNHPALIDPLIMYITLHKRFRPRPLADESQVNIPVVRQVMKLVRCVTIPDIATKGRHSRDEVVAAMAEITDSLHQGDNVLLYPSGRIYHSRYESIRGNGGVAAILKQAPDIRVVLVRTTGLWGSSFSKASGRTPTLLADTLKHLFYFLVNGIFFMPRRQVVIELTEPLDIPHSGERLVLNRYLEDFYNKKAPANSFVPHFWWQGRRPRIMPEPCKKRITGDSGSVPDDVRQQVFSKITEMSGAQNIDKKDNLASELGIDSLGVAELAVWIEQEFGYSIDDLETLNTAGDLLLAASGQIISRKNDQVVMPPARWFSDKDAGLLMLGEGQTITELFLQQARKNPGKALIADLRSGVRSNRDIITALHLMVPVFAKIPGANVGLMLPAGVGCTIAYLALLFAGKTPVMVNWTVGEGNMAYCLDKVGAKTVISAKVLVARLAGQGIKLDGLKVDWLHLEDMAKTFTLPKKIAAKLKSYGSWSVLARHGAYDDIAAILFTSGSEARPKAVPLSHGNFLANLRDVAQVLHFRGDDSMLGILPPFHSLGLTGTLLLAVCLGMKTVYHPNPTEAGVLAKICEVYKTTVLVGTPTFLNGILRAAEPGQLDSLRLVFTGAEKCPQHVYQAMAADCPQVAMCEAYGVTECSPGVSINSPEHPVPGTIGSMLPSMEYVIVDVESRKPVARGEQGMLLVRGPNVFKGYLNHDGKQPFVEHDGKEWYETGDLVSEDAQGILTFRGRLKRFIKLGGEMISLPAIEAALLEQIDTDSDDGVPLAVEATPDEEQPEVVLFVTFALSREQANKAIRAAGLSPLHNVRRLVAVAEIPVLGTGKTDYQALKKML